MIPDTFVLRTNPSYPCFPHTQPDSDLAAGLRALWIAWGKDPDNPFGEWVAPGGSVVIKPNWVRDYHPDGRGLDCLVTHTSVVAQAIEWAATALRGRGSIVVGDAPLQDANFENLLRQTRLSEIVQLARERHPGLEVVVEDWRLTLLDRRGGERAVIVNARQFHRDGYADQLEQEYRLVDLGRQSFLEEVSDYADRFRVTTYDPTVVREHHRPGKHEYLVTNRIFGADLFVNLSKMKTHMRAGLTGALKNLVGINGHKEYLPHHTLGGYYEGGDNYLVRNRFVRTFEAAYDEYWKRRQALGRPARVLASRALQFLWRASLLTGGDGVFGGSWSGNDTVWRTTLDLNHILHFSPDSPRHVLQLVDGVTAGEGLGPLRPVPRPTGLVVVGEHPAYVDAVLARIMGYNVARIPTVYHAIYNRRSQLAGPDLDEFSVVSVAAGRAPERIPFGAIPLDRFVKPPNWARAEAGTAAHALLQRAHAPSSRTDASG